MNKIRMLLDNWGYDDYRDFVQSVNGKSDEKTIELVQQLIVSWDYKISLDDEQAIAKLGLAESGEVLRTVTETIQKFMKELDTADYKVEFSQWTLGDYMRFDTARVSDKWRDALKQAAAIVTKDGEPVNIEGLTYPGVAAIFKAVQEAYIKVISGKN